MSRRMSKIVRASFRSLALAAVLCGGMAHAQFPDPYPTVASVSSIVTQTGPATWQYRMTIHNDSVAHSFNGASVPFVYWFMVPYFADAGITDITCPGTCWNDSPGAGWFWSTPKVNEVGGSPGFGHPDSPYLSRALSWDWSSDVPVLEPGTSLTGFGFTASYAPVKGPFNLRFALGEELIGDPAVPGSPFARAAGYVEPFPVAGVPEPGTWALLLAGLGWLVFVVSRRSPEPAA